MPEKRLYDTRFFMEYFYAQDTELLRRLKHELLSTKEKVVSVLTVHEMHRIDMKHEGAAVATLRSNIIRADCKVIDVDYEAAVKSAELRSQRSIPMADSIIAVTAQIQGCTLVSDDLHFKGINNLKIKWV